MIKNVTLHMTNESIHAYKSYGFRNMTMKWIHMIKCRPKINFCLNVNLHQACDYKSFIAIHVALSPRRDMLALIMDSTSGDNQVNDPW